MPKISLSGTADLLTVIPFQLGFRPHRSVVVVCFHDRRMGMVARLDAVAAQHASHAAAQLLPTLRREAPTSVSLVGFEDGAGESMPLSDALAAGLALEGLPLRERLLVRDGRWYRIGCDCCPADDGTPMPDPADVPAVASYVALGQAVLDGRDALRSQVEPLDAGAPSHALIRDAIDDWQARWDEHANDADDPHDDRDDGPQAPFADGCPAGPGAEPEVSARELLVDDALVGWGALLRGELEGDGVEHWLPSVVGPLRDRVLRDAVIAWICPGTLSLDTFRPDLVARMALLLGPTVRLDDVDHDTGFGVDDDMALSAEDLGSAAADWARAAAPGLVLSRLEAAARVTPAEHAAPLLSVVASFAWWAGDGARASVAVDRALELEPEHHLCLLIRRSLDHGLRGRVPA
jgi:hypothetical protein